LPKANLLNQVSLPILQQVYVAGQKAGFQEVEEVAELIRKYLNVEE
jgi:hypothetical protein